MSSVTDIPGYTAYSNSWKKYGIDTDYRKSYSTAGKSGADLLKAVRAEINRRRSDGRILYEIGHKPANPWVDINNAEVDAKEKSEDDYKSNPFKSPEKPQGMSDAQWKEIKTEHEEELWPAREKIISRYLANSQQDQKNVDSNMAGFIDDLKSAENNPDPAHAFQVEIMSDILTQKVRNGYQLTADETALFPQAAQTYWYQNLYSYGSQTQSVSDAVKTALAQNNTAISKDDSFSIKFDKNLYYTVSGTNSAAAKTIEDTINSSPDYRYQLASALCSQFVCHGSCDCGKQPKTSSEYYDVQLYHYIRSKISMTLDPSYPFGEATFPQSDSAPITFSNSGFSRAEISLTGNGKLFNTVA